MRVAVSTAHGADEVGGGQGGVVFAACAFLLSFRVRFQVCSLDDFFHCPSPAGTITRSNFQVVWIDFN